MSTQNNCPFSAEEIASEGIKPEEYEEIVRRLGRHPNKAELGMFGVMWSEHCCYKNSRPLLKQFPTTGERILVGPGENAGVVDFGDGLHIAFKIESHNHPSAIEPFQGAATGVGGILRDIFTMGARPIAALNSLRFGCLEDSRNRQIFKGVVSGISHYGNCLIASERFVWRDNQGIYFDTIGNFVESHLLPNETTTELNQAPGIETLSIDPETQQSCWQPVTRVFKRQTQTLITFRTALGRTLTVTPDHLILLLEDGKWCVREAKLLKEGDLIPLLINLPLPDFQAVEEIPALDLLETLNDSDQGRQNVYVQLPEMWQPTETIRAELCLLEPSATNRYQYIHKRYLPLPYFLKLETLLNVQRREILLFRRSGKANYMKAVIKPDETFARFLGYYLSEGCVSANGNTYKIILTFALHEQEYVDDVVQGFKDLGLRPCIEKRKSTIAVYATSWLLGYVLKEVWQCGEGSANKAFPSFVFTWPKHLQREALKGLMRGDGSFTTKTNGSHAKIAFGSTSQKLFEQALALIQSQGAVPSVHYRPSAAGEIEGRPYQSLPFWELEVSNISGLSSLTQIFYQERDEQLVNALNCDQGNRYSFPRFDVSNELAFVKVRSVETKSVELCNVYDVEVENTHLFVTTSGIVTHNCFGVPTVGGEVYFDPAYNGNPLVNAMAIGLMETPEIVKSGASGIGNPVLYVGSTTGRDGMGGASFASAELSEESIQDRPAVQVGDPFLEKSLVEACLEAFKTGAVVAAQDMGAAGITCSTSEMAAKGGVGIELDLDLIPVRETGMVAYEYLLSESQERMLFVAQKGREQELIDIFHRWGLQAVVAGTVIAEPIVRILFQGGIAAEIPADALAENTPLYPREILSEPPEYVQIAWQWQPESLPESTVSGIKIKGEFQSWNQVLLTLLDTPSIASKRWVYRQYDHQVQNNTVLVPGGGDAAVIRLRPLEPRFTKNGEATENTSSPASPASPAPTRGLAATVDCNSRYVYLDPYEGAKATVAEAARNLSCVGAEPIAVTDNLNFGSPEKPIGYWQLAESCRGISDGCKAFNTPVTGGNVSLYNETLDADGNPESIYPTPVVGMVGLITDLTKVCGQGWQSSGDLIYLLGDDKTLPTLGASEYLAVLHGTIAGKPPRVDFHLEEKVQAACREGIRQGWIKSAHDCGEGGLAVALAEACISGKKGATVKLGLDAGAPVRWDNILFGEGGGRILVSVSPEYQSVWEGFLQQQLGEENQIWQNLGFVGSGSEPLRILADDRGLIEVELGEMGDRYFNGIERRLNG